MQLVREKMGVENILINNIRTVIEVIYPGVVAVFCMGNEDRNLILICKIYLCVLFGNSKKMKEVKGMLAMDAFLSFCLFIL